MSEQSPFWETWTPQSVAARAAGIQAALLVALWMVLGYWNARHSWLLEFSQQRMLRIFFWRELPILGLILLVALPAMSLYRLADEATLDVEHEAGFVDRILGWPRAVAVLDMVGSVVFFFLGALQLRVVAQAPALEASKIIVFGFLAGVLFGVASYLLLQPVIAPLLVSAARRGVSRSRPPAFPLTQKIIVACLAIAFVVTGLVGQIALSWAQRFAEARSEERSRDRLRLLVADAIVQHLHDAASCRAWLERAGGKEETLAVLSSSGLLVASWPAKPAMPDGGFLASEDWREAAAKLGASTMVTRRNDTRVVTSAMLPNGWRLVSLVPPDPVVLRAFLASVLPICFEIVALSLLVAWAVGRGLSRPVRDLEARTRKFGEDPLVRGAALPATDDEIGRLIDSFRRMEEEVRTVQGQLRESERRAAIAELLAGVAHEVRNPLFGITSTAAALEAEIGEGSKFAPHLAIIRKEGERLARMIEEMLALQRAPRRATARVTILPIIDRAAAGVRARFGARSPDISVDAPFDLEIADADPERVESVFSNLFENAVLSSPSPVRVSCRARREGSFAAIAVEDDGPGLPVSMRDRIFEPFVTSRPGGTGVGLAVSRQIVLEHGGTIEVTSAPDDPTAFTIRLPAV